MNEIWYTLPALQIMTDWLTGV